MENITQFQKQSYLDAILLPHPLGASTKTSTSSSSVTKTPHLSSPALTSTLSVKKW
jgi:hypothetical protein